MGLINKVDMVCLSPVGYGVPYPTGDKHTISTLLIKPILQSFTLRMASAQVVETSVNTNNSPSQDYTTNPDDHSNHNSFDIKIISRKTFWRPLKPTSNSGEIFVFQNLVLFMRYHNTFFVDLKLYL